MFFNNNSHLLNILLALEVLRLIARVVILFALANSNISSLILIFFTLVVCEAALGLSLIVKGVRSTGSEASNTI